MERQPNGRQPAGDTMSASNQGALTGASKASLDFLRNSSMALGPSLMARVRMALAAAAGPVPQVQGELIKVLVDQVPPELALPGPAGRRGLILLALRELAAVGHIIVDGNHDSAVVHLVPPEPDSRFEVLAWLSALLPPASPGADAGLERELLADGCRYPLVLWHKGKRSVLVDGHRRLRFCLLHRLEYGLVWTEFADDKTAAEWVWQHHDHRRNLSPAAQSYARGRHFNVLKLGRGRPGAGNAAGNAAGAVAGGASAANAERIAGAVAAALRVSRRTLFGDSQLARALDDIAGKCGCGAALRTAVLGGTVKLGRLNATLLAGKPEAEMNRLAADLLAGKKVQLRPARPSRLVLSAGSVTEMAEAVLEKLGKQKAVRLGKQLLRLGRAAERG
jgi:hypothetical protein